MKPPGHTRIALLSLLILAGCAVSPRQGPGVEGPYRGVNLGNTLEFLPGQGQNVLKDAYFPTIREAGFDFLRVPVKWPAHAALEAPYALDSGIFDQVDEVIDRAFAEGLAVVVNMHHYDEIVEDPAAHEDRFLALWRQISEYYSDFPPELSFELLNEPSRALDGPAWNRILNRAIEVIRETNPTRTVVVGPVYWNSISGLERLELPADDANLHVTFHYYFPFRFTHQGARWVPGSRRWMGTPWLGTAKEKKAIRRDLNRAARWGRKHRRPMLLGEFGAYSKADHASRVRWTSFVAREAERRNMAWAYWEFYSGFGVYNPHTDEWRQDLLRALIPNSPALP